MELLRKFENTVHGWMKGVPHLPEAFRKWLAQNVWWVVLIGVILGGIGAITSFFGLIVSASLIGSASNTWFAFGGVTVWSVVVGAIGLAFSVIGVAINAFAISPLKAMKKKGWVLLFLSLLVSVLALVVTTILNFNFLTLFANIVFGAVFVAIAAYLLFEIHSYFGVIKATKTPAKKPAKKSKK